MQIQSTSHVTSGVTNAKSDPPSNVAGTAAGSASVAVKQKQANETKSDPQAVEKATQKIQAYVSSRASGDIQFATDQDSGKTVVKVIDHETQDILMQFPSKKALAMASSLDKPQGILVEDKA
jgi:flagellar protein FlaG